ncbi:beta-lactamase family protein [Rhodococcus sp. D2-41]|uniref:serine hydrolase domain-containing protein n=1 Tax=Speluncibacter jeojiensis TaxID=2710754 RepID=UPI002410B23E|nr:serine hydrolase domain-containing protein [Rhodococcus sp. D2-41]MDG3011575.1 beta-lactamase family protein [Rhodococcus sp. D2-41]
MSQLSRIPQLPRIPLLPDPLRRIRVPRDLDAVTDRGSEVDPRDVGMDPRSIDRIWNTAVDLYRSGVHPAIQLCVRREGQVVLNRSIGHSDGNGPGDGPSTPRTAATTQTPFGICSASKAITAVVAHLLAERGVIDLDIPVGEYIPDFARHGKESITIAHLLSHRAGIPLHPAAAMDLDHLDDRAAVIGAMCETRPVFRPGRQLAYHAVTGGIVIGEVVERVTGDNIRTVLAREILDPLGFRWTNYGVDPADDASVGKNYVTGLPTLPPLSLILGRILGTSVEHTVRLTNDRRFLTSVVPSGNVVTTAEELSRFFELLRRGGELDGVRVLNPGTVARAIAPTAELEVDCSLGVPLRYSRGFMLGERRFSLWGPDTANLFGHLGLSNVLGWADPDRAVSVGLITSGKPVLYPEMFTFLAIPARIATETPKTVR